MQQPLLRLAVFPSPTPLRQNRTTASDQENRRVTRTPPILGSCTTTRRKGVSMAAISGICEVTGVAPLICLSFSDGPQNAADLVEYCNGDSQKGWGAKRAANGHPAPYRAKYWQIGNEINGDDENYVSQFPRFVELMKQADPAVEILSSFPTQKLLDRVGKDIAF